MGLGTVLLQGFLEGFPEGCWGFGVYGFSSKGFRFRDFGFREV